MDHHCQRGSVRVGLVACVNRLIAVGVMIRLSSSALLVQGSFLADKRSFSVVEKIQNRHHHHHQHRFYPPPISSFAADGVLSDISSSLKTSALDMKKRRYRSFHEDEEENTNNAAGGGGSNRQREKSTDRPTQTLTARPEPDLIPQKPKIVVLGASGKVGRLVVRQLLESNLDATIVAFVRDYDKAIRVLYDDMVVLKSRNKQGGPKLQIVEGDLVPPQELPGYDQSLAFQQEEADWLNRAQSAAAFYGKTIQDYDNRNDADDAATDDESDESLQEAIRGCTTIISCVGSVRPTNVWNDYLSRPLIRMFRHDVSRWCTDARHPYYVTYLSTRKALEHAEREQLRREMAAAAVASHDADESSSSSTTRGIMLHRRNNNNNKDSSHPPRIRFIRISDLCVAQKPWQFIPVLTNMLHSMVFRYQDMAERLLESSTLIDTIVLRPGDLVDDERDVNTTSLQVHPSGHLPTPARVGRSDVAALAVAAALFQSKPTRSRASTNEQDEKEHQSNEQQQEPPIHYTLAVRWAGGSDAMSPYPAQGHRKNGLPTAKMGLQVALRSLRRQDKRKRMRRRQRQIRQNALEKVSSSAASSALQPSSSSSYSDTVLQFAKSKLQRRKLKPYGIFVAIPVYFCMAMMLRNIPALLYMFLSHIPGFTTHVAPTLTRIGAAFAIMGTYVWNQLGSLAQAYLPEQVVTVAAKGRQLLSPVRLIQRWLGLRGSQNFISI